MAVGLVLFGVVSPDKGVSHESLQVGLDEGGQHVVHLGQVVALLFVLLLPSPPFQEGPRLSLDLDYLEHEQQLGSGHFAPPVLVLGLPERLDLHVLDETDALTLLVSHVTIIIIVIIRRKRWA